MLEAKDMSLLERITGLRAFPSGAFNIRRNARKAARQSTPNIDIQSMSDKPGLLITVKPHTRGESVHIPVLLTQSGLDDLVYNTFDIGEGADVTIVAGCGIHNPGSQKAQHDGIHTFTIGRGAHVRYIEKHYGEGEGSGTRILNPKTVVTLQSGASMTMELTQIRGVDDTKRDTEVDLGAGARLVVTERLLTTGKQQADSLIDARLRGADASAQILSRSVAQDQSRQTFRLNLSGYARSRGHIQCDSIIMHDAQVYAIPQVSALHSQAQLIHEAAIGRIESEQLIKLMSLGLTQEEAEASILKGFLR